KRAQLDPDAITFALDQCQFCLKRLQQLSGIFSETEVQKLDPAGRLAVSHPLASQRSCGWLSVSRQPSRDGKNHQQESFEGYFDHGLCLKSRNRTWTQSVQGAIATWSLISMRYSYVLDSDG